MMDPRQREFNLVKQAMEAAHSALKSLERFIDNLDPSLVDASTKGHTKLTMSVTMAAQKIILNLQSKLAPISKADLCSMLADLRSRGWRVAVHNDYQQNHEFHTFWLFTYPNGKWCKGEAETDLEAVQLALNASQ